MKKDLFIQEVESKNINMSWLAQKLGCSYVGLSRCYKKPIVGQPYTGKNLDEVYDFIERNNLMDQLDKIDFNTYSERRTSKEQVIPKVEEQYQIDKEDYIVVFVSEKDVCFMNKEGSLRSMSIVRFNSLLVKGTKEE